MGDVVEYLLRGESIGAGHFWLLLDGLRLHSQLLLLNVRLSVWQQYKYTCTCTCMYTCIGVWPHRKCLSKAQVLYMSMYKTPS